MLLYILSPSMLKLLIKYNLS